MMGERGPQDILWARVDGSEGYVKRGSIMHHIRKALRALVAAGMLCVLAHLPHVAYWGTYDGHRGCWAYVADTSVIACRDGYVTTS